MQKKRSQVLFAIMLVLVVLSIAATYFKTVVQRDFVIIDDLEEELTEE